MLSFHKTGLGIVVGLWLGVWSSGVCAQSSGSSNTGSGASQAVKGQVGDVVGIAVLGVLGGLLEGSMIYYNASALARRDYDFTFPLIGLILGSVGVGLSGVYLAVEKEPSYALGGSILAVNGILLVISAVHLGLYNRHTRLQRKKQTKTVSPLSMPTPPVPPPSAPRQILWQSF